MNRFATFLALSMALMAPQAIAGEQYVGTITSSGTSKTNGTTSSTFKTAAPSTLGGLHLAIQCDAAAYVRPVEASDDTVTSSNGVKVAADTLFDIDMAAKERFLAVISVSGTANCKVFVRSVILR